MGTTLFDKIWTAHKVADLGDGDCLIHIDRIFLHERTGAVALKGLEQAGRTVRDPKRVFCTMDHIVDTFAGRSDDTRMPGGGDFIRATREAARANGLTLFDINDPRQGIVHVISPEQGIVLPGLTLVCPDSHTCTQGAFGAMAWGIGSTEAEHAMATGTLRLSKPRTLRVRFTGALPAGVSAKDMALSLIGRHSAAGAKGMAVEFDGTAVRALDMAGRMTLCNMAVEFGAFTGLIAPDEKTVAFLKGRPYAPTGALWDRAVRDWQALRSDADASFDAEIEIDAATLAPMVTWGTSPEQVAPMNTPIPDLHGFADETRRKAAEKALNYMGLTPGQSVQGLKVDAAFIGSCTNSRLSDLERAAGILKGRRVAPGLRAICVPGSTATKRAAEDRGIDRIFREAGFEWRESGCSMCFFAGGESFGYRDRVISSTNRNFENRQGPETRTHIASPETVAASAILGHIGGVADLPRIRETV